ncbi:MAG: prolyl oligopeptidase family serine peptidase [Vulcanimicrobiaceae bacterium]|jgi:alpha-beta hydrolase superfamily lysophospholipase
MLKLSSDPTFHYELLRVLGTARDLGADVAEVLDVAERIIPGDFESWSAEFDTLANRVRGHGVVELGRGRSLAARNAFFRAASYFRSADFFLHGSPSDRRISSLWDAATACFDQGVSRLGVPAQRVRIAGDGFDIPAIFYRVSADWRPRPTLLLCNGFDGSQEELFHVIGRAALERGFHVVTFEGPGQPTVLREQGRAFVESWEDVVRPVVDWCETQLAIDSARLGLFGYSLGGWLAARAAAREPRIAALACVDGIFDVFASFSAQLPLAFPAAGDTAAIDAFNDAVRAAMVHDTGVRWAVEHGCWAFGAATPYDFLARTRGMTLAGLVDDIACPVLVCDAEDDHAFRGQPALLAAALGARATYRVFGRCDAASLHCSVGASDVLQSVVLGWFEEAPAASIPLATAGLRL